MTCSYLGHYSVFFIIDNYHYYCYHFVLWHVLIGHYSVFFIIIDNYNPYHCYHIVLMLFFCSYPIHSTVFLACSRQNPRRLIMGKRHRWFLIKSIITAIAEILSPSSSFLCSCYGYCLNNNYLDCNRHENNIHCHRSNNYPGDNMLQMSSGNMLCKVPYGFRHAQVRIQAYARTHICVHTNTNSVKWIDISSMEIVMLKVL